MARRIPIEGDPTAIGEARTIPFARVPVPQTLFERRSARLERLSGETGIGPYIGFLAKLVAAQGCVSQSLGEQAPHDESAVARAIEHGMPPLDRSNFRVGETFSKITDALFSEAASIDQPAAASKALERVRNAGVSDLGAMVGHVLADSLPVEAMAEHVYVAAALQVQFVRAASMLPERDLKAVGDGVCPSCGGAPLGSVIVGWPQAGGARYCVCSLCSTYWHHVRIKCVLCSSTGGIKYQEIEGGPGTIKAETCENCRSYVKIFNQQKDSGFEPMADDVGSLGVDLLMQGTEFRRGAFNPFLAGY